MKLVIKYSLTSQGLNIISYLRIKMISDINEVLNKQLLRALAWLRVPKLLM